MRWASSLLRWVTTSIKIGICKQPTGQCAKTVNNYKSNKGKLRFPSDAIPLVTYQTNDNSQSVLEVVIKKTLVLHFEFFQYILGIENTKKVNCQNQHSK